MPDERPAAEGKSAQPAPVTGADREATPRTLEEAVELIEQLRTAVEHRTQIGQAVGILMERYALGGDAAFQRLSRESQERNRKLHSIALELTQTMRSGTL